MAARDEQRAAQAWARRVFSLDDFEGLARRRLPACVYGFAANGAEDGLTLAANRRAFGQVTLAPVALADVSDVRLDTRLFGQDFAAPVGVAPMGAATLFRHHADLALARAARGAGLPFVLSAASSVPLETVAAQAPGSWYQAYLPGDTARIDSLLARLRAAAFEVLVLTIDVPVSSNRDSDRRRGFEIPLRPTARLAMDGLLHPRWLVGTLGRLLASGEAPRLCNMAGDGPGPSLFAAPAPGARTGRDRFAWEHVAHIRRRWTGPLLLKGVLSAEMARRAQREGVDGVIVSNHGGRQLDGAPASLDALMRIREVVPDLTLGLDGGVRRGADVAKAMALGAAFVLAGRPFLYAATVGGEAGVAHGVSLLTSELRKVLALLGCTSPAQLDGRLVWSARGSPCAPVGDVAPMAPR